MYMPAIAPSDPRGSVVPADVVGSADDLDRLRVALLRLSRRIRANSVGELTPSQFSMFVSVVKFGPCTVSHLAELEHVKAPSASKIVAALEGLGLVERREDPEDRRCSVIVATRRGHDYFDEVRVAGRSWLASRVSMLDADDVGLIDAALPALERLLATES
jgi:DNA-binding MarR family transcriptional regulator